MIIHILTLFPEFFDVLESYSIIGRALEEEKLVLDVRNIRDYSEDKHKKVDDAPFGGGPGMVMKVQPIASALEPLKHHGKVYYLSPQGTPLSQKKLMEMSKEEEIILLNGHYEGIDERVISHYVDEEISIGDYVLTGGEIPTMVLVDGITRLLPGVLAQEESYLDESHATHLLEYPQYTRPRDFMGLTVPDVLLSGNHREIELFRKRESLRNTWKKRPDLLEKYNMTPEEKEMLLKIKNDQL